MRNDVAPSFLRPPPERGVPLLWWLLGLLALGLAGLYVLRMHRAPVPAAPAATVTAPAPSAARTAPPATTPQRAPARAPVARPSRGPETVVTRCESGGRTTFTDGDYAPGAHASELRVRRDLNLADGAPHLPRARLSRAPAVAQAPQQRSASTLDRDVECRDLAQRIQGLDAQARQPQSARMQDWISARRHEARSRQFALRC